MFGISQKRLEKKATNISVSIGVSIATLGILLIIDNLLKIDFFPNSFERFGIAIMGVAFIVLSVGVFISVMLNVSRIANSIEQVAEHIAYNKTTLPFKENNLFDKTS